MLNLAGNIWREQGTAPQDGQTAGDKAGGSGGMVNNW
jgi:hypothetical protein